MDTGLTSPSEALGRGFVLPRTEQAPGTSVTAAVRRYGVRLNEYGLLLPEATLCEVATDLPSCRLPNTPGWFCGVLNQRGNMVPVFDMCLLLEADAGETRQRGWDVIVGQRESAAALRVPRLPEILSLTAAQRLDKHPAVREPLNRFISASYYVQNTLWFQWDLQGFLLSLGESLAGSH